MTKAQKKEERERLKIYECQIMVENRKCGKQYAFRSGSGKSGHMGGKHAFIMDAPVEFRKYQELIRGTQTLDKIGETASFVTRVQAFRNEQLASNMRKPLVGEIQFFHDMLLDIVVSGGAPFSLLEKACIRSLYPFLNRNFSMSSLSTLERRLRPSTNDKMERIKSFLSSIPHKDSLALDGWTSLDKRKFLGITFHFFSSSTSTGLDWHPTNSLSYIQYVHVHSILPPFDSVHTAPTQVLHKSLQIQIDKSWPLQRMTDHELLATYLNPACAANEFMNSVVNVLDSDKGKARERNIPLRTRADELFHSRIMLRLASQCDKDDALGAMANKVMATVATQM